MSTVSTYEFSQLDGDLAATRVEDVLSAAWAEAEQVRAQARAEGFQAGRTEGLAAFRQQSAPALAALGGAASALDSLSASTVTTLQEQAAELALAIAEQILSGVVEVDHARVVDVCRGALRRLSERSKVTIVAHPADLEVLTAAGDGLAAGLGGIERFEVQADRRVDRGGVLVRTEHGEIDASLATQLARAREIVIEALRSDGGGDDAGEATHVDSSEVVSGEVMP